MEASRLLLVFLAAFVGGAILNVMPCVLPVLSLKILSFMQQAGENHSRVFAMGLVYGAGVMASFAVLGAVMVSVGLAWGGFMQEPLYVLILCTVVFAFALSLLGVWELHLPGIVENVAGSVTTREGYGGAFLNGLMATALATPCVAPFLGTAIGTLVSLPGPIAFSGIMVAGLGMATPYVLLTAFPGWLRFLPKPGKWMITFKQFMGFVLLGTCVWLLWVLQFLVQPVMLVGSLAFLTFVALGCWMIGKLSLSATAARTLSTYSTACVAMVVGWYVGFQLLAGGVGFDADPPTLAADEEWRPWRPGLEEELSQQGYTVYVDYTAQWCTTCQYNKATVLKTDPVKSKLKELGVVMIEADFTRKNPEILKALRKRNRAGVPLNVLIPAGNPAQEIVLPELLTSSIVLDALQKAGPSKVKSMAAGQHAARALGAGQPAR
jgi:thiol:disulfide interchange protein DsbD